jgi:hypothetical protein
MNQIFGMAKNILGPVKGQGIRLYKKKRFERNTFKKSNKGSINGSILYVYGVQKKRVKSQVID